MAAFLGVAKTDGGGGGGWRASATEPFPPSCVADSSLGKLGSTCAARPDPAWLAARARPQPVSSIVPYAPPMVASAGETDRDLPWTHLAQKLGFYNTIEF
jgi:hypothetical protein